MATAQKKSTAGSASAKKSAPKKAAPKKEEKPKESIKVNEKLADPSIILKSYEELIDNLAKVEAAQKMKQKPYRIYFVHRKRAEVMKLNFIKSMR